MRLSKGLAILLLIGSGLVACGDAPLTELGGRSAEWIDEVRESPTVTTKAVTVAESHLVSVDGVAWWNMELAPLSVPDPGVALSAVTGRRSGADRFVQASPFEVAAILPDMRFPAELPREVMSITSQLVLAPDANTLDDGQVAAFGLWTVEPYTQSRASGQAGTIFVSWATGNSGCGNQPACDLLLVAGSEVKRTVANDLITLTWSTEGLDYELALRSEVAEHFVDLLRSFVPLREIIVGDEDDAAETGEAGGSEVPAPQG